MSEIYVPTIFERDKPAPVLECTAIDLDEVVLFGFEKHQKRWKIVQFIRMIEEGVDFDPVPVEFISELPREYVISGRCYDEHHPFPVGGHHRAIAHKLTRKPLPAAVIDVPALMPKTPLSIDNLAETFKHVSVEI